MPDIRFKDLPSTAGETSSDDFIAIDGTISGTRKLSAFSPVFGGFVHATGSLSTDGNFSCYNNSYFEGNVHSQANLNAVGNVTSEGFHSSDHSYKLGTYPVVPSTDATYASIYIDPADGDLKVKFSNAVVKTIATN